MDIEGIFNKINKPYNRDKDKLRAIINCEKIKLNLNKWKILLLFKEL